MRATEKNSRRVGNGLSPDAELLKLWPKYQAVAARAAKFNAPPPKSLSTKELRAWDRAAERAFARWVLLQNQVYALRPRSARGLSIKAQVLADEGAGNKPSKDADLYERGLWSLPLDAVAVLSAPVTVSRAVVDAIAAHDKAQAKIAAHCVLGGAGLNERLAALVQIEDAAAWAILDVEPASVADVALILAHSEAYVKAGHLLPERRLCKGETYEPYSCRTLNDDLVRAAAGWLSKLAGLPPVPTTGTTTRKGRKRISDLSLDDIFADLRAADLKAAV